MAKLSEAQIRALKALSVEPLPPHKFREAVMPLELSRSRHYEPDRSLWAKHRSGKAAGYINANADRCAEALRRKGLVEGSYYLVITPAGRAALAAAEHGAATANERA